MRGRAWWLTHALKLNDGSVSVARIKAIDKDGELHILELTEEMLDEYKLIPGTLKYQVVVDGTRPRTNKVSRPVDMVGQQLFLCGVRGRPFVAR